MDRESAIRCARCMKVCNGETLRFNDQLFHANCLVCLVCGKDLADVGFFVQNNQYFCPEDFQERFGTKCHVCHQFLEGEGINIGGNAYHERCFVCATCRNPFPPGEKVVSKGNEYVCQQCSAKETSSVDGRGHKLEKCAGCGEDIRSGQSLLALEKQWHLWCFTCTKCGCLLAGEYMGRDGKPYCEKDYQAEFGVSCAGCGGYIIGKVLQAGEKHYHPQCSRCARCHGVFGEGQEMFLQGSEIWHPDCSFAAQQDGELDMRSAAPRDGYQNGDDEAHRPSPPTRTSASRTTDWKVKYSPQKEEEMYRQEPWRGSQEEQPAYQPRYMSHTDSRTYNSGSYVEITSRREANLNEAPRETGTRAPLDMQEFEGFEREVDKKPLIFAYKDLKTTNYKLPRGADKTKLETYLKDEEFHEVFKMTRDEFYQLPPWKQASKKKEVLLF
ncbi:actin-binding LIM protein 3-like isoform X2 [Oculina patagonica]